MPKITIKLTMKEFEELTPTLKKFFNRTDPIKVNDARSFIADLLRDREMLSSTFVKFADAEKIPRRTLARARSEMGVTSFKRGNKWYVSLTE